MSDPVCPENGARSVGDRRIAVAHEEGRLQGDRHALDDPPGAGLDRLDLAGDLGLALVGDAALASDPLFGIGIGWAFQSAERLVEGYRPLAASRSASARATRLARVSPSSSSAVPKAKEVFGASVARFSWHSVIRP